MKIAGIAVARPDRAELLRLAGYGAAGFLTAGCCLDGRAPLAAGFTAACRPGKRSLAALVGAAAGSFFFLPFARPCGAAGSWC